MFKLRYFWPVLLSGFALGLGGTLGIAHASQSTQALLALKTDTGSIAWLHPLEPTTYSRGPIAGNGKVLLHSYQNWSPVKASPKCSLHQLRVLDSGGRQLWTYTPEENGSGDEAIAREAVVFGDGQLLIQLRNRLNSLDPATGKLRWSIPRFWFLQEASSPPHASGILYLPKQRQLVVQQRQPKQRLIQLLDPATGKVLKQFAIPRDKLTVIDERMAAIGSNLFIQTSKLIPSGSPDTFFPSERSTLSAYRLPTGQLQFRQELPGDLGDIQAEQDIVHLTTFSTYDPQRQTNRNQRFLWALDGDTGRVLWGENWEQLGCRNVGWSKRVMGQAIYVSCNPPVGKRGAPQQSLVLSLAAKSGLPQWRYLASPNSGLEEFPNAANSRLLFTIRRTDAQLSQAPTSQMAASQMAKSQMATQYQAIAIDRQTGKLRWTFPLYDGALDGWVNGSVFGKGNSSSRPRPVAAADAKHFYLLARLPRWQTWLLQLNPAWYVKPSQ